TYPILQELMSLDISQCLVDIGKILVAYKSDDRGQFVVDFVQQELAEAVSWQQPSRAEATDVVLYGFGRIGRLLARLLIEKAGGGKGLRLIAIVVCDGGSDVLQ